MKFDKFVILLNEVFERDAEAVKATTVTKEYINMEILTYTC
jgi:hypothetical protein